MAPQHVQKRNATSQTPLLPQSLAQRVNRGMQTLPYPPPTGCSAHVAPSSQHGHGAHGDCGAGAERQAEPLLSLQHSRMLSGADSYALRPVNERSGALLPRVAEGDREGRGTGMAAADARGAAPVAHGEEVASLERRVLQATREDRADRRPCSSDDPAALCSVAEACEVRPNVLCGGIQ
eukprot:3584724-Pleurochrysis_carterae.AAC.1